MDSRDRHFNSLALPVVNLITKAQTTVTSNSIAVFPFDNMRNDTEYEWLTDSFSESLTFKISSSKTLKVIDRLTILNTLKQYDPKKQDLWKSHQLLEKRSMLIWCLLEVYHPW